MEPQRFGFIGRKPEHEVFRETVRIAADSSVQIFREDLVQARQICIDHDFLGADEVNPPLDSFNQNGELFCDRRSGARRTQINPGLIVEVLFPVNRSSRHFGISLPPSGSAS